MRMRASWCCAAVCLLALGACSKQADQNPVAPGRPGTGNGVTVLEPAAPDGPRTGSGGMTGAARSAGTTYGDVPGVTGSGNAATAQPGTGLSGGIPDGGATAMGASPVASGTSNSTTGSSFGNRP